LQFHGVEARQLVVFQHDAFALLEEVELIQEGNGHWVGGWHVLPHQVHTEVLRVGHLLVRASHVHPHHVRHARARFYRQRHGVEQDQRVQVGSCVAPERVLGLAKAGFGRVSHHVAAAGEVEIMRGRDRVRGALATRVLDFMLVDCELGRDCAVQVGDAILQGESGDVLGNGLHADVPNGVVGFLGAGVNQILPPRVPHCVRALAHVVLHHLKELSRHGRPHQALPVACDGAAGHQVGLQLGQQHRIEVHVGLPRLAGLHVIGHGHHLQFHGVEARQLVVFQHDAFALLEEVELIQEGNGHWVGGWHVLPHQVHTEVLRVGHLLVRASHVHPHHVRHARARFYRQRHGVEQDQRVQVGSCVAPERVLGLAKAGFGRVSHHVAAAGEVEIMRGRDRVRGALATHVLEFVLVDFELGRDCAVQVGDAILQGESGDVLGNGLRADVLNGTVGFVGADAQVKLFRINTRFFILASLARFHLRVQPRPKYILREPFNHVLVPIVRPAIASRFYLHTRAFIAFFPLAFVILVTSCFVLQISTIAKA